MTKPTFTLNAFGKWVTHARYNDVNALSNAYQMCTPSIFQHFHAAKLEIWGACEESFVAIDPPSIVELSHGTRVIVRFQEKRNEFVMRELQDALHPFDELDAIDGVFPKAWYDKEHPLRLCQLRLSWKTAVDGVQVLDMNLSLHDNVVRMRAERAAREHATNPVEKAQLNATIAQEDKKAVMAKVPEDLARWERMTGMVTGAAQTLDRLDKLIVEIKGVVRARESLEHGAKQQAELAEEIVKKQAELAEVVAQQEKKKKKKAKSAKRKRLN